MLGASVWHQHRYRALGMLGRDQRHVDANFDLLICGIIHLADQVLGNDRRKADPFVIHRGYGPGDPGHIAGCISRTSRPIRAGADPTTLPALLLSGHRS
jgi:hypothetical protein